MAVFNNNKKDADEYHSDKYTILLNNYVKNMDRNVRAKLVLKIIFFIIVMCILGGLSYTFYYTIKCTINAIREMIKSNYASIDIIVTIITPLMSSFGTIMVSLLKLPEIIAHYLFNPEEDESAVTIVGNIQKYDISMYAMKHNSDEKLAEENHLNSWEDTMDDTVLTKQPESKTTASIG